MWRFVDNILRLYNPSGAFLIFEKFHLEPNYGAKPWGIIGLEMAHQLSAEATWPVQPPSWIAQKFTSQPCCALSAQVTLVSRADHKVTQVYGNFVLIPINLNQAIFTPDNNHWDSQAKWNTLSYYILIQWALAMYCGSSSVPIIEALLCPNVVLVPW